MDEKLVKKSIIYLSIAILIVLSFAIVWPILISVIAGLILAYILYPVYKFIFKFVREKNISALILVLLLIFLLFIPVWFLLPLITRQVVDAYSYSQNLNFYTIFSNIIPESLSKDTISVINSFISKLVNSFISGFSEILLNMPELLLKLVVVLFTFFFATRDSEKLKDYAKALSPFSQKFTQDIAKQFKDVTSSVIFGQVIVGLLQGILTGIGLFIFGVKSALLLSLLSILCSIFPIIGAWLVWLPISIYLFIQGNTGSAIGLFLYGSILVSWIDNIIKPYIVARKIKTSSAIILIGMIGGLIIFGFLGLILGPLIFSYLLILLDAYKNKKLGEFFNSE